MFVSIWAGDYNNIEYFGPYENDFDFNESHENNTIAYQGDLLDSTFKGNLTLYTFNILDGIGNILYASQNNAYLNDCMGTCSLFTDMYEKSMKCLSCNESNNNVLDYDKNSKNCTTHCQDGYKSVENICFHCFDANCTFGDMPEIILQKINVTTYLSFNVFTSKELAVIYTTNELTQQPVEVPIPWQNILNVSLDNIDEGNYTINLSPSSLENHYNLNITTNQCFKNVTVTVEVNDTTQIYDIQGNMMYNTTGSYYIKSFIPYTEYEQEWVQNISSVIGYTSFVCICLAVFLALALKLDDSNEFLFKIMQ